MTTKRSNVGLLTAVTVAAALSVGSAQAQEGPDKEIDQLHACFAGVAAEVFGETPAYPNLQVQVTQGKIHAFASVASPTSNKSLTYKGVVSREENPGDGYGIYLHSGGYDHQMRNDDLTYKGRVQVNMHARREGSFRGIEFHPDDAFGRTSVLTTREDGPAIKAEDGLLDPNAESKYLNGAQGLVGCLRKFGITGAPNPVNG